VIQPINITIGGLCSFANNWSNIHTTSQRKKPHFGEVSWYSFLCEFPYAILLAKSIWILTSTQDGTICWPVPGQDWAQANSDVLDIGIQFLDGLGSNPSCLVQALACVRVSCSQDCAIWWCNQQVISIHPSWLSVVLTKTLEWSAAFQLSNSGKWCLDSRKNLLRRRPWNLWATFQFGGL